jgi:hypothetical protein
VKETSLSKMKLRILKHTQIFWATTEIQTRAGVVARFWEPHISSCWGEEGIYRNVDRARGSVEQIPQFIYFTCRRIDADIYPRLGLSDFPFHNTWHTNVENPHFQTFNLLHLIPHCFDVHLLHTSRSICSSPGILLLSLSYCNML